MESSSNSTSMITTQISLLLLLLFVLLTPTISAQVDFVYANCSGTTYSPNSTYQSNLNTVLNSLSSDARITSGFYNFSSGQGPSLVNSLAICRGDVPVNTCRQCIQNSAGRLQSICQKTETFLYSDFCRIFVSNSSINGVIQESPLWDMVAQGPPYVTNASQFNRSLQTLLTTIVNEAASGNGERKYSAKQANLTTSDENKLYGLAQCTPDLNKNSCIGCLDDLLAIVHSCCWSSSFFAPGFTAVAPSCFIRYNYDLGPFYGNIPDTSLSPSSPTMPPIDPNSSGVGGKKKSSNGSSITIPIPIVAVSVLVIIALLWVLRRRKKMRKSRMRLSQDEIDKLESLQFSFGVIKNATEDFKEENKLGQGGFGTVYKGVLSDGHELAVKKLSRNSGKEGDVQFKNEILILAKLQHKNLVKLLGFCLHEQDLLLIYELVANGSLDKFLFDSIQRESMQWETRFRIINGIARGLLYLHEESRPRIIHRDLKAGNVLLDKEFNPKIADFGMARLFNMDQTQTMTSRIVGTYGYMPPEYVLYGQVSVKSDVFSFGVLVLEIISGQRISSFLRGENPEDLLSFAWRSWQAGTAWNLVDTTLSTSYDTEILRCIHIGLLCVQENPVDRPTTSSVALMLRNTTAALPRPSPPAFYIERNNTTPNNALPQSNRSGNSTDGSSLNGVSITEIDPR